MVVSAVVGSNDNGIILGDCLHNACNVFPAVFHSVHVFFAHPSVCMSCFIGVTKVKEREVSIVLVDVTDSGIGQAVVCLFPALCGSLNQQRIIEGCRMAKVTQLPPTIKRGNVLFFDCKNVKKAQQLARWRDVGVPFCAVMLGRHAKKERHVATKRNRRHNRSRIQRINRVCHYLLRGFAICQRIGAHTVNQNQQSFHSFSSLFLLEFIPPL